MMTREIIISNQYLRLCRSVDDIIDKKNIYQILMITILLILFICLISIFLAVI